ncbi:T9SS type A sorting domain-containing protein, partial [bacterium]|nr:T9SS type A sorting domain-containing protein [bacterium]
FTVYTDFHSYSTGCYENPGTNPTNHCMLICGWDDSACDYEGAWLVKNSWDTTWGDGGYVWIKYGTCNVGSNARLLQYYPGDDIVYRSHDIDDSVGGDGDGRPDPGETVDLDIEIRNDILSPNRTGVTVGLATSSQYVEVTDALVYYGDIDTGESKIGAAPFGLVIDEFAPAGVQVEMEITIAANMIYASVQTFTLVLGPVPVLLVDDDGSTSTQTYFQESLERNGYVYDLWSEDLDGNITADKMDDYPVVIWNVGWNGNLNGDNRTALATYLDAGHPLFISGEDIGWSLDYYGNTDFLHDYLHADYIEDDSGYRSLDGVSEDPIGDGMSFTLNGGDSAMNQFYPSEVEPRDSAVGILEYAAGLEGAIRMDAAHHLVFYAFGIEGATGAAVRDTLVRRTLEWLVDVWPDTEQPTVSVLLPNGGEDVAGDEDYEITWDASDNVGVTSIDILLSRDSGVTFTETLATGEANDGSFMWAVPDSAYETNRVRVVARDAAGLAMYDDSDADFATTSGSGVSDWPTPEQFALFQNAPNPFNPITRISYTIPSASRVTLDIFDVSGRLVRHLLDADVAADRYEAIWNGKTDGGSDAASGVYLYRLTADGEELERKMVLLR